MEPKYRALCGFGHGFVHCVAALFCLLFVEFAIEYGIANHILTVNVPVEGETEAMKLHETLYQEYSTHFAHIFQNVTAFGYYYFENEYGSGNLNQTYGMHLLTNLSKFLQIPLLQTTLSLFDLPGQIAQQHISICSDLSVEGISMIYGGEIPIDRIALIRYLLPVGLYYIVFAIPLAGSIFGTWLALCLNVCGCQWNGGFSSLRIQHWKNFLRMNIKDNGDLQIFAIGVDRVPKMWVRDNQWSGSETQVAQRLKKVNTGNNDGEDSPSWSWERPSKWVPERKNAKHVPKIIDEILISKQH